MTSVASVRPDSDGGSTTENTDMADQSPAARMRALMSRFEEKKEEPPPPRKERFQSTLDAPRPELSSQAKSAQRASVSKVAAEATIEPKGRRYVPQIAAGDTDEERELKRQIQAKEQEIMDMAAKLVNIAERLDRVVETFHASIIQTSAEAAPVAAPSDSRAKAFDASAEQRREDQTASSKRTSATSAGGTSLEAILAAARGGGGKERVKSETPKYSKLLRDMK